MWFALLEVEDDLTEHAVCPREPIVLCQLGLLLAFASKEYD